jgi:hypothetical protein
VRNFMMPLNQILIIMGCFFPLVCEAEFLGCLLRFNGFLTIYSKRLIFRYLRHWRTKRGAAFWYSDVRGVSTIFFEKMRRIAILCNEFFRRKLSKEQRRRCQNAEISFALGICRGPPFFSKEDFNPTRSQSSFKRSPSFTQ